MKFVNFYSEGFVLPNELLLHHINYFVVGEKGVLFREISRFLTHVHASLVEMVKRSVEEMLEKYWGNLTSFLPFRSWGLSHYCILMFEFRQFSIFHVEDNLIL